jgi:hypothetical protein
MEFPQARRSRSCTGWPKAGTFTPLILGGIPQAENPFKLTACEESDSASLPGGALFSAAASLTFEEYT